VSLSVDDLIGYFRAGAKPRSQFRIGIEQEKIGARRNGAPVGYAGPGGIEEILGRLEARGFGATREHEHVVGLERGGERITIEPGGQLEFSGLARDTAAACRDALVAHVREVVAMARPLGVHFSGHRHPPVREARRRRLATQAPLRRDARILSAPGPVVAVGPPQ
jgi:glutamate--cysteine ligase